MYKGQGPCPPRQPGSGTTDHEVSSVGERSQHARPYLFGGLGKADHTGPPATDHRGVTAVEPTGTIAGLDPPRVKGGDEGADQGVP